MLPAPFGIEVDDAPDGHVVHLVGELDLAYASQVRDALRPLAGSTVVLDLSRLTFVDAAGISAILAVRRDVLAAGHELRIRGAHGPVRRVFEVCSLEDVLSD